MRLLAFDGRMGASGDMLLGALVAAGADPTVLETVESELGLQYDVADSTKCGIGATTVTVRIDDEEPSSDDDHIGIDPGHAHDHRDAGHTHSDDRDSHERSYHGEGEGQHRTYPEVVNLVEAMGLSAGVEEQALGCFERLGHAESRIHGTPLKSTQFHEVGADDAIADVVGVSLLLNDLDVDRVVTTPIATGGGSVSMSHGHYPVPAPAVVEIAEMADWAVRGGPLKRELLTPTGAAILAEIAASVETLPTLDIDSSGYGAGSKSFKNYPNVLRAMVGETESSLREEPITVLETHLDDTTPEVLGGLSETLADAGALDVTIVPTTMKKSRPGHLVKVVTHPSDAHRVARKLARETGTLGVREHGSGHRFVADRVIETVTIKVDGTQYPVNVKVSRFPDDGTVFDISCEFDDAQQVGDTTGRPTREIIRLAEQVASETYSLGKTE
ncbi:nickel pincer cofactor biosynthesis protein LarC [Halovenus rubra]|uniref:Nickel pincer cofactor biosynthesis protein LarC n=2 Tax=Halovenus rubra TaxID=869890 RepID=A0ACC7DXU6_9EURY|nr:nickel pincer cofactor biosynthesis protein LarC [Halovenus rubra]